MAFQKGRSGNPSGRPKKSADEEEVERLARTHAPFAIERLAHWAGNDNARASVAACSAILDRAFGKPRQQTEGTLDLNVGIDAELLSIIRARSRAAR